MSIALVRLSVDLLGDKRQRLANSKYSRNRACASTSIGQEEEERVTVAQPKRKTLPHDCENQNWWCEMSVTTSAVSDGSVPTVLNVNCTYTFSKNV